MEILMMYVPFGSIQDAENTIQKLLNKKLIACGNIVASQSLYFWQENMSNESEWIALMKSKVDLKKLLEAEITKIHPYQVPAILSWRVECNEAYFDWVSSQVITE